MRNCNRIFRVRLSLGIELIFLPIAEPECNGEAEELNGLWGHAFWGRQKEIYDLFCLAAVALQHIEPLRAQSQLGND